MPIKLVPKQYRRPGRHGSQTPWSRFRAQERAIMQLCVRDARMPRAGLPASLFPGNETNLEWLERRIWLKGKIKYAEALKVA